MKFCDKILLHIAYLEKLSSGLCSFLPVEEALWHG